MEHRGYTRVSARRWIKDPHQRIIVPPHIQWLSIGDYRRAMAESVDHRDAVKDCPQRPDQLVDDFYEPEIYTVRRSDTSTYLQRQDTMDEPCAYGETQAKRSRYSRDRKKMANQESTVTADIKVEVPDKDWF